MSSDKIEKMLLSRWAKPAMYYIDPPQLEAGSLDLMEAWCSIREAELNLARGFLSDHLMPIYRQRIYRIRSEFRLPISAAAHQLTDTLAAANGEPTITRTSLFVSVIDELRCVLVNLKDRIPPLVSLADQATRED